MSLSVRSSTGRCAFVSLTAQAQVKDRSAQFHLRPVSWPAMSGTTSPESPASVPGQDMQNRSMAKDPSRAEYADSQVSDSMRVGVAMEYELDHDDACVMAKFLSNIKLDAPAKLLVMLL